MPATGALRILRFWCSAVRAISGTARLGPSHFAGIDWVRLNAGAELEAQALIMIRIRQCVFRIIMARIDEIYRSFILKRGEILPTVIVMILHDLLSLLNHVLHPCCFLLLTAVLLPYFGVRGKSAVCCGVLNCVVSWVTG